MARTIVPNVPDEKTYWSRDIQRGSFGINSETGDLDGGCEPLLHAGPEKLVYALRVRRGGNTLGGLLWALPSETSAQDSWLLHVLSELAETDPESFASTTGVWHESPEWMTAEAELLHGQRVAAENDRRASLERLDAKVEAASIAVTDAIGRAKDGTLRLLTDDGDSLVAAVLTAFEGLGFTVEDRDGRVESGTGAKLEDLRVTRKVGDWTALVEVKGYVKGAKVNDVRQVAGRPSVAFAIEHGRAPDSIWHVVNHMRTTNPSARPVAIPNEAVDLAVLNEGGGALIDTRDLFRAIKDVERGIASAEVVAQSLVEARVRWTWPS